MPGIRLHATNPLLRAGEGATTTFVVELPLEFRLTKPGGRDRGSMPCQTCGTPHRRKAVHLRLDSNGDVIVAPDIYTSLLGVPGLLGAPGSTPAPQLEVHNAVKDPPPLKIGAVDKAKERIVQQPLNQDKTPAQAITPASTKYENEQRIWRPFVPIMDAERERLDRKETKARREKRRLFVPKKKG